MKRIDSLLNSVGAGSRAFGGFINTSNETGQNRHGSSRLPRGQTARLWAPSFPWGALGRQTPGLPEGNTPGRKAERRTAV